MAGRRIPAAIKVRFVVMRRLKLQIPFRLAVFVARENGDLVSGKLRQWLSGIPGLTEAVLNQFGWNFEIHQEIGMGAAEAVVRLPRRERQCFFDQLNVEVEQD